MDSSLVDKKNSWKGKLTSPFFYREILYLLLSFLLPFSLLLLLFSQMGFAPFKENGLTIISFDMQSEYVAYLRYYRDILRSGGSLLYTQGKVFGGDFLSIFTFYLASPFNLFVVFFDNAQIPEFFLFTSILKMSLSSVNFYLLVRFLYKKCQLGNLIFALSYSMVSYSMIYISNYMWLDGVMILPLMILGMYFIKEGKRYWLYPLSVFYGLATSWYIGFILCVFAVLYFLFLLFSYSAEWRQKKPFVIRTVLLSLIGGMMASFLWVAAFLHFSGTKATQSFPSFFFNSFAMFFTGFLENNYPTFQVIEQYHGYVSMFTGVISLVFALRYFLNRGIEKRERLASLFFVFILFLFTMNSILNALFHGGREPTWFPGRYTFVIGFFVCFLAAKEWDSYSLSPWYSFLLPLLMPAVVLPIVLYSDNSNNFAGSEDYLRYSFSLPSLLIYLGGTLLSGLYPCLRTFAPKPVEGKGRLAQFALSLTLIPLTAYSTYRGNRNILQANIDGKQFQESETYEKDNALTSVFDALKSYDSNKNYRMEALFNRPGSYNTINNNPMFYSYNGLSHYSSSEKKDVEAYFEKLGFQYNYFFEKYDGGSTAAINSFLNVRYLIDDGEESHNKPLFQYNQEANSIYRKLDLEAPTVGYSYYENTKVLPYAFIIDDSDSTYVSEGERKENGEVRWYDHFEYQNEMFSDMDGSVEKTIFQNIPVTRKNSNSYSCTVDEDGRFHISAKKGTPVSFTFTVPTEAKGNNLYFGEKTLDKRMNVYLDDSFYEDNTYWHKGIRGFRDNASHEHTLRFVMKEDVTDYVLQPEVYYENLEVLNLYLDRLREGGSFDLTPKTTVFSSGYRGTFTIKEGNENRTLLFTFPMERGMSVKIDGKRYKTMTRMNVFTAADFSSLSLGKHTLEISYTDVGFDIGAVLSVLSFGSLVFFCVYEKRKEKSVE